MARRQNGNGNGSPRAAIGDKVRERMQETLTRTQASQVWTSIFRPGSIFRQNYTDSPFFMY